MFPSASESISAALTVRARNAAERAVPTASVRDAGPGRPNLESLGSYDLAELARVVRGILPWRDRRDEPVQMDILTAGYLDVPTEFAPEGWPYVLVGVASWDAADAVHASLAGVSLLSEAAWVIDWSRAGDAFRSICVPLDLEALGSV